MTDTRRIAIAVDEDRGLESRISAHFGRCPHYVIVDVSGSATLNIETVANPHYADHKPGRVPAFVAQQGARTIIAGGMGQKAKAIFDHHGIDVVTGAAGSAGQALEAYLQGRLTGYDPCRGQGLGHGQGHGQGRGAGGGQGKGRGCH
jgi:predicted Fe-Mo cluster-binding NifX family protein